MHPFDFEIKCPVCGYEFIKRYQKGEDGLMEVECPNCGEELVFSVIIRTQVIKKAFRDSDIYTKKEYFGEI